MPCELRFYGVQFTIQCHQRLLSFCLSTGMWFEYALVFKCKLLAMRRVVLDCLSAWWKSEICVLWFVTFYRFCDYLWVHLCARVPRFSANWSPVRAAHIFSHSPPCLVRSLDIRQAYTYTGVSGQPTTLKIVPRRLAVVQNATFRTMLADHSRWTPDAASSVTVEHS